MSKEQEQLQKDDQNSEMQKSAAEEGFANLEAYYIGPEVITEEKPEEKPKKQKKQRTLFKLIVSVILSAILLILLLNRKEAEAPIFTYLSENAIQHYTDQANQETYIYNSNGEQLQHIDMYTNYALYNLDHTAAAIVVTEKFTGISIYSLYYVNESEVSLIKRGISNFAISDNGKYIMYSQKQPQGGSALFLYQTLDKTEIILDSGKQDYSSFCFSPDENSILFASETTSTLKGLSIKTEGFLISDISSGNLTPVSIGTDRLPVAVSDRAEFIYFGLCIDNLPGNLYVKYQDETRMLAENYKKIIFNRDRTEIIYYDGKVTNICLRGNETIELTKNMIFDVIMPTKAFKKVDLIYRSFTFTYGTEYFRNMVVLSEDGSLLFINDDYKPIPIDKVNMEEPISISEDGNTLTYMNTNGTLISVKHLRGSWKTDTVVKDLEHWMISEDLTQTYYIQDRKLFYYKDKMEPQSIMDDADRLFLQTNGTDIYLLTGKPGKWKLYTCSQGIPVPVESVEYISAVEYTENGVAFRQDLGNDYHRYYYPSMSFKGRKSSTVK